MNENDNTRNDRILSIFVVVAIVAAVIILLANFIVSEIIAKRDTTVYVEEFGRATGSVWLRVKNEYAVPMTFYVTLTILDENGNVVYSKQLEPIRLSRNQQNLFLEEVKRIDGGSLANCSATVQWTARNKGR